MIVWVEVPSLLQTAIAALFGLIAGVAFLLGRHAGQTLADRLLGVRPW